MSANQWERVKDLFHAALARRPEDRQQYILDVCGADEALQREVRELLAAHMEDGNFVDTPAIVHLFPNAQDDDADNWSGRRVGVYRITEEIGSGGMSRVYRAQRDDGQFEQQVAVKILRPSLESRDFIARFRSERQVLAGFSHPNIARLLDGGRTDEGKLYLVMECIDGQDIFEYCERRRLGIPHRIELFRALCSAVQYVHQRLTIHGDLKCRNVLVTEEGNVKLLDFGLARLLGPTTAAQAMADGMAVMTPNYASPEQLRGEPLTTATDIYSLGVVLHRLLTGELPVCKCDPPQILGQHLCDSEVRLPSALARRVTDQRGIRGDLDFILERALRRDPARRYASVEQLSQDLRRHLLCLPILARENAVGYRAGRFIRRHTLAVAASALFVLILIGTTVAMSWQAHVIGIERTRAEGRFNDVRKLANSLIFDIHDSIRDLPGAQKSRHLLIDTSMHYLDSLSREAAGDPALQRELAAAYLRLGDVQGRALEANESDYAGALQSYRHSLALLTTSLASTPHDVDTRRDLVVNCGKLSDLLWHTGDAAGALSFSLRTVSNSQLLASSDIANRRYQALLATSLTDYGYKLFKIRGATTEALKYMRRSIASLQSLSAADPTNQRLRRTLSLAYGRTAEMAAHEHRYAEALSTNRDALRLVEALRSESPENTDFPHLAAFSQQDIATALIAMGRLDEAERAEQTALSQFRTLAAAEPTIAEYHTDMSRVLAGMADIAIRRREPSKAITLLNEASQETARVPESESASGYFRLAKATQESLMGAAYAALAADGRRAPSQRSQDLQSAQAWYRSALILYQGLSAAWFEASEEVQRVTAAVEKLNLQSS